MENYYNILGVDKSASLDEIKHAYIREMKKYHPDIFRGDQEYAQKRTAQLNVIYQTLKDQDKREKYDKEVLKIVSDEQTASKQDKDVGIFGDLLNRLKRAFESEKVAKYKPSKELKPQKPPKQNVKTTHVSNEKRVTENNSEKSNTKKEKPNLTEQEKAEKLRLYLMLFAVLGVLVGIIVVCLVI